MALVIGFGASSMQGVGDSQGGFLRRVSDRLKAEQISLKVENHGISGQTTREMLRRAPALLGKAPYDVVVMLGCNDLPREGDGNPELRTSRGEYLSNLEQLLTEIRGGRSLFVSSFSVSETRTGICPDLFADWMGAAMRTAKAAAYEVWDLYGESKGKTAPWLAPDGLHFNDAGHAMIADKIWPWVVRED